MVHEAADADANIIFGSVIDDELGDEVKITVIATGFQQREERSRAMARKVEAIPTSGRGDRGADGSPAAPRRGQAARGRPPRARPRARAGGTGAGSPADPGLLPPEPAVYRPGDEDQYDIPAFLRRGGNGAPRE